MHEPTKILMGSVKTNVKDVDNRPGEIAAGTVVHLKDDGTLSVESTDGSKIGVSLGKSLSDTERTAIARRGLKVPVLLTEGFDPDIGDQVHISDTTGLAIASGSGATGVNAVYVSERMTGITETGTEVGVALTDFPGGL